MHSSLRTKIVLWFLFVAVAVGFAGYIGFRRLSDYILHQAHTQMDAKLDHVIDVLATTNSTYLNLVRSSMAVLRMLCLEKGEPRLDWAVNSSGSPEPVLYFGTTAVGEEDTLVDRVKELMGGTAGIFARQGDTFVRVSTNVLRSDGSRAVGSVLDPYGAGFTATRRGDSYFGLAEILGKPYLTGYEPIRSADGDTIGVFYIGFPLASLSEIKEAMNEGRILSNGFFALLDDENRIVFRTENVRNPAEVETIVSEAEQQRTIDRRWLVKLRTFVPWDYDVVAAVYLPDVLKETFAIIWQVYGIGSVILIGVLIVSFLLASRLSQALGDAEKSRREALEARDAAESANRTKSTFLANMSHELRTPMNAILGYSEMLIDEAEDLKVKELTPDLNKIRHAGKHLLSLINDILDLSKIEAGKMTLFVEEIDVASLVREVATTMQPLIEKNSNKLELDVAPNCGRIRADLPKIRQTLLNLLGNATKFTEGGQITFSVRRIKTKLSSVDADSTARNATDRIQFSTKDTGIGMTPEQQAELFQPFSQTDASTTRKYGGTGLGLAISRRFCELMGGDISVTSAAGQGSTFTVDLPVSVAPTPSERSVPGGKESSNKLVLVITDSQDDAETLKAGVSDAGFTVVMATNWKAGLDVARTQKPTVVALNVGGTNGWSVLATLKSDPETANLPVIIVTMLPDGSHGFALGASEFLVKPIDAIRLREVVTTYCAASSGYTLVLENDLQSQQLVCRSLEKEGLTVRSAKNPLVALEQMEGEFPALILLDLMMPGLEAFEFMRILRQDVRFAKIPVVITMPRDFSDQELKRLARNLDDILMRSVLSREGLVAEITALLDKYAK